MKTTKSRSVVESELNDWLWKIAAFEWVGIALRWVVIVVVLVGLLGEFENWFPWAVLIWLAAMTVRAESLAYGLKLCMRVQQIEIDARQGDAKTSDTVSVSNPTRRHDHEVDRVRVDIENETIWLSPGEVRFESTDDDGKS